LATCREFIILHHGSLWRICAWGLVRLCICCLG
jgi:hypothetical protein